MIKKIKELVKNNPHIILALYWPLHGLWYSILQQTTMARDPYPIVCGLDKYVPFVEWMVIPYVLWYVQLAGMMLYTLIKQKENFLRLSIMVAGGCFVCMVICTLFPMYFDRSGLEIFGNDNVFTDIVKLIQGIDPPTTILPSMHVYVSLALHIGLCKDEKLAANKLLAFFSLVLSLAISASTVLIRQHSVIDVGAAILLLPIMYCIAYLPRYSRIAKYFRCK